MEELQNNNKRDDMKIWSFICCTVAFLCLFLLCLPFGDLISCCKGKTVASKTTKYLILEIIKGKGGNNGSSIKFDKDKQEVVIGQDTFYLTDFKDLVYNSLTNKMGIKCKEPEKDNKQNFKTIKPVVKELLKSFSVYSASIERIEDQYKIYDVILCVHFEDGNKYILCKILKNKKKKYHNEIRFISQSYSLMNLLL